MKIFIVTQHIKKCSDNFVVIAFAMLCAKVQFLTTSIDELPNGSDHKVIACYLGLYEEGEVEHINGVWSRASFVEK